MLIEELINKGYYELTRDERQIILEHYIGKTGTPLCTTCTGSFIKAYNELKKMAKKENTPSESTIKACKYEFKPGYEASQIQVSGLAFAINADNLSDELVENYLENHPLIQVKA